MVDPRHINGTMPSSLPGKACLREGDDLPLSYSSAGCISYKYLFLEFLFLLFHQAINSIATKFVLNIMLGDFEKV